MAELGKLVSRTELHSVNLKMTAGERKLIEEAVEILNAEKGNPDSYKFKAPFRKGSPVTFTGFLRMAALDAAKTIREDMDS